MKQTIITSSSDKKLELAKKLGATYTINYKTNPDWDKEVLKVSFAKSLAASKGSFTHHRRSISSFTTTAHE